MSDKRESKQKTPVKFIIRRVICLLLGLFILAYGIALSAKSGLGVGATSSIPYVFSSIAAKFNWSISLGSFSFNFTMGQLTMVMNIVFALLQVLILRKDYKPIYLAQLAVVFFFSYFTDLTLNMVGWAIDHGFFFADYYWQRIIMALISNVVMAVGVFLEVRAGLITMATEGLISALALKLKKDFGTMKIIFDWTMIVISLAMSLIFLRKLEGIREGTVIAAFLVGFIVRIFNKYLTFIYPLLGFTKPGLPTEKESQSAYAGEDITKYPLVITIEREWGSGGHEIGEKLAKQLGIPFYDYAIISETAAATGKPADEIKKKEQKIGFGLVQELYYQGFSYSQELPEQDKIFEAQQQVIKNLAEKGSCVIVGRLGSYVLKNRPNSFHMFVSGGAEFRNERIAKEMNVSLTKADELRRREDIGRANHCRHFTGKPWGLAKHYALCLDTAKYGIDESVAIVMDVLNKHYKEDGNQ